MDYSNTGEGNHAGTTPHGCPARFEKTWHELEQEK